MLITVISIFTKFSWETRLVIISIGLAKSIESLSDILFGLMQQRERMDRIAISFIIRGFVSVLALGLGLFLSRNMIVAIIAYAICWAMILLLFDVPNTIMMFNISGEKIKLFHYKGFQNIAPILPKFTFSVLRRLSWLALPLGIVVMLTSLQVNIPRYFIGYFYGERELGVFAAISYALVSGTLVVQALGTSVSPKLSQYYHKNQISYFYNLLFKFITFLLVLGVLGLLLIWLYGREFLSFIYQPEYAEYLNVFLVLTVAAIFKYLATFLRAGLTAIRYINVQVPIYTSTIITSVIICYILIPKIGIMGAAFANLSASLLEALICGSVMGYFLLSSSRIQKEK